MKSGRPSRKQGNRACRGRSLRVETLEPRRLLAFSIPNIASGDVFVGDFDHPAGFQLEARTQGSVAGNLDSPFITVENGENSPAEPGIINGSSLPDGAGARVGNSVLESHVVKVIGSTAAAKNDWYREEVAPRANNLNKYSTDYWYGFSMYVPQDWVPDGAFEGYAQWRLTGPGAGSVNPTLSLGTHSDSIHGPAIGNISISGASYSIEEFRGEWTDFVIHARWSGRSDGVLEGWRRSASTNDVYVPLFARKDGPNSFDFRDHSEIPFHANNGAPSPRLGLYKASWRANNIPVFVQSETTERTLYYDEFRIASGSGALNSGTFNTVKPPGSPLGGGGNTSPTAFSDTAITAVNTQVTTVDVLANDTDPNQGDTLSVQSFTQPDNGAVIDNGDGTFTYTPDLNFNGVDTFDYTVSDGNGGTDVGTVSVTVGRVSANVLLRYDFTNGSGTTVVDQSGNGNTGTLTGFSSTAAGAGVFNTSEGWASGGGINFLDDSVRSFVETTLPLSSLVGKDATIEFTSSYAGALGFTPAIGVQPWASFQRRRCIFLWRQ